MAKEALVQYHSDAPQIRLLVVAPLQEDLGRHVQRRALYRRVLLARFQVLCEAKVGHLQRQLRCPRDEQVLRLQVKVRDVVVAHILQCGRELSEEVTTGGLG